MPRTFSVFNKIECIRFIPHSLILRSCQNQLSLPAYRILLPLREEIVGLNMFIVCLSSNKMTSENLPSKQE